MERRSESETHPPPATGTRRLSDGAAATMLPLPRPYHPAMERGRGLAAGRAAGHNTAPVPRRYPSPTTTAPRGRVPQRSKSRLGPCPPPPVAHQKTPCWRFDADGWRNQPPDAYTMPPGPNVLTLSPDIANPIDAELGNYGMILLLFETPSGFALFSFVGTLLCEPNAMENLWAYMVVYAKARLVAMLREFQTFDDKFCAINFSTGVSERLQNMILRHRLPGQILAVSKDEYKIIIENTMGIPCMCGETVMEAMRCLQNLMLRLVPEETSQLTKEDRLPMSHGLKMVLSRNGFGDVEQDMVNEQITMTAYALFQCDYTEKKYDIPLSVLSRRIKAVSGIDTDDWNKLKLAAALKVIFGPEEVGDYDEMFSEDERSKLVDDAHKYARIMGRDSALAGFKQMVSAYEVRNEKKILMRNLVTEAKERMKLKITEDS